MLKKLLLWVVLEVQLLLLIILSFALSFFFVFFLPISPVQIDEIKLHFLKSTVTFQPISSLLSWFATIHQELIFHTKFPMIIREVLIWGTCFSPTQRGLFSVSYWLVSNDYVAEVDRFLCCLWPHTIFSLVLNMEFRNNSYLLFLF